MADYTYNGTANAPVSGKKASMANWAGAAMSLGLVVGVGVWGYGVMARDVSGVPVVEALAGPMRVAPKDPGGRLADNQGLAVNVVAGNGAAAAPADQLLLAPRPAGLAAEDVALGAITPTPQPIATSLAREAEIMELDAGAALAEDDPVQALANLLANGAQPLTALAPGEDAQVVTGITDVAGSLDVTRDLGPGLARSLRPKMRPSGLRTASLNTIVPAVTSTQELDAASLPIGTRLVQIGAFDSTEAARAEWQRLEGRFGDYLVGKSRVIQKASSGGRVFYRLRAHGFIDLSDARRFCSAFVAQNVDCIPVVTR